MKRRFIDVRVKHEPFVDKIEDIYLKVKTTKNQTIYSVDYDKTIILDENGKEYVLTFCYVDYGAGGPTDCIETFSFIFKVNEQQLEVLKNLTGHIGDGNINFENIKTTLSEFGNPTDILKIMDISEEDLDSDIYGFLNEIPI